MKLRLIQIPNAHGDYERGVDKPLKPCPFCGSVDINVTNTHSLAYWTECETCGAQGPSAYADDGVGEVTDTVQKTTTAHLAVFNKAIDNWNCRGKTE